MSNIGHNSKSYAKRWHDSLWEHADRNPARLGFGWIIYRFMGRDGELVTISNTLIGNFLNCSVTTAKALKKWFVDEGFVDVIEPGNSKVKKSKIRATIPIPTRAESDLVANSTRAISDPVTRAESDPVENGGVEHSQATDNAEINGCKTPQKPGSQLGQIPAPYTRVTRSKTRKKVVRRIYGERFEKIWKVYFAQCEKLDCRAGTKGEAEDEWKKLSDEQKTDAEQGLKAYVAGCSKTEQSMKHLCRYLKYAGWEEFHQDPWWKEPQPLEYLKSVLKQVNDECEMNGHWDEEKMRGCPPPGHPDSPFTPYIEELELQKYDIRRTVH